MKVFIVLLTLAGFVQSIPTNNEVLEPEWESFKLKYHKSFGIHDDNYRRQVFKKNKEKIDHHNARYEAGEETFEMGVNQFADLSQDEFESRLLSGIIKTKPTGDMNHIFTGTSNPNIPPEFDWRYEGAVTEVKNQGKCKSSWAFSAIGALEGQHFLKTGKLVALSEQQLVDCTGGEPYNLDGCCDGLPKTAFQYVWDEGGVNTNASYPYEDALRDCRFNNISTGSNIIQIVEVEGGNEMALAEAVANVGPISVLIDIRSISSYKGGIITKKCKKPLSYNHAALVVGYGTDKKNRDYWVVKNSWGREWGEKGYFRMVRNKKSTCGIADYAVYPVM